jgi:hypothetical protein
MVKKTDQSTHRVPAWMISLLTELEKLHPDNRHVKDKIRQQLAGCFFNSVHRVNPVKARGVWRLP